MSSVEIYLVIPIEREIGKAAATWYQFVGFVDFAPLAACPRFVLLIVVCYCNRSLLIVFFVSSSISIGWLLRR